MAKQKVKSGLDVFAKNGFKELDGLRIAILANQSSIDSELRHVVDLIVECGNCTVVRIFAPEHGFRGDHQDMEQVEAQIDKKTGLPIMSLYGESEVSLAPTREAIGGIDALVVDLQDIGTRYYTYTQTMMECMKLCALGNVKVFVIDRPNPLNGNDIEGAILTDKFRSFCGYAAVTNRHGLTIGEHAQLLNEGFGEGAIETKGINCELQVIEMEGWDRDMYFDETGLPWVLPSPNMPTLDTAIVYPGMCLFEATNLSEGRGTTRPFELIGAPFIDSYDLISAVQDTPVSLKGAELRPTSFIPQFQKWAEKTCFGVQIHVTDRSKFQPFRWGLALISALKTLYPDRFGWRRDAYEFVKDIPAIDLLFGTIHFRKCVETKNDISPLIEDMKTFETWFLAARKEHLIYKKKTPKSK